MSQCVMMTGIVVGGIVFGSIADKYGRKKPLMLAIVIQATGSYLVSFAPYYWSFLVVWFILAFGCGGIAIISFVICMEVSEIGFYKFLLSYFIGIQNKYTSGNRSCDSLIQYKYNKCGLRET